MTALTKKQTEAALIEVPAWSKRRQKIIRTFKFEGFSQAITFVNRIAKPAQTLNHHPDIDIRYDKVILTLTTHDAGGLTEKDFTLAAKCDAVFAKF